MIPAESIQLAGALGAGLNAGMFFAFSTFVMRALARLTPEEGIRAMQAINETVINPLFMLAFLGTSLLCGAEIVRVIRQVPGTSTLSLIAALLFLIGTFGVTIGFNVPLNDRLAACDPAAVGSADLWQHYLSRWTQWNHVRTLAAMASLAAWWAA